MFRRLWRYCLRIDASDLAAPIDGGTSDEMTPEHMALLDIWGRLVLRLANTHRSDE